MLHAIHNIQYLNKMDFLNLMDGFLEAGKPAPLQGCQFLVDYDFLQHQNGIGYMSGSPCRLGTGGRSGSGPRFHRASMLEIKYFDL